MRSSHWQCYCTALEQWASAKHCGVVQGMELLNIRSSSFSRKPHNGISPVEKFTANGKQEGQHPLTGQ